MSVLAILWQIVVELRWPESVVQGNLENAEWMWTAMATMF